MLKRQKTLFINPMKAVFASLIFVFLLSGCLNEWEGVPGGAGGGTAPGDGSPAPGGDSGAQPDSGSGGDSPPGDGGSQPGDGGSDGGTGDSPGGTGDGGGLPGDNGYDPAQWAQNQETARALIEFILSVENPLPSQLLSALETAQLTGMEETDPLVKRLYAKVQSYIDSAAGNPKSTIKELLEAASLAQGLGLNSSGAMDVVSAQAESRAQAVVNDPNSTIWDLIAISQLMQSIGGSTNKGIDAAISQKLSEKLASENMCKRQLLDIAAMAQGLGFEGIASAAKSRAESAQMYCVSINSMSRISNSYTHSSTIFDVKIKGDMEEFSQFGFVNEDSRIYYFSNATLGWTYYSEPGDETGCIRTTRTGNGSIQLNSINDGTLNVTNGEEYGINIYKLVEVKVEKTKNTVNPSEPHECDYITADDLKPGTEEVPIEVSVNGTTENRTHIVGSYTSPEGSDEDYIEIVTSSWDMLLPDKSTAMKIGK